MEPKTGIFRDREGRISQMRFFLFIYFITFVIPGNWVLLSRTLDQFISKDFTWEQVTWGLGFFLLLHTSWIAPKLFSKLQENSGMINRILANLKKQCTDNNNINI